MFVVNERFSVSLWASLAILILCVIAATNRAIVSAIILGIACMRFSVAWFFSRELSLLLAAAVAGFGAYILSKMHAHYSYPRDASDNDTK